MVARCRRVLYWWASCGQLCMVRVLGAGTRRAALCSTAHAYSIA